MIYYDKFFVSKDRHGLYLPSTPGQKAKAITKKEPLPFNINPLKTAFGAHTSYNGYSAYVCIDIDCSKEAKEKFLAGNKTQLEKEKEQKISLVMEIKNYLEQEGISCLVEDSVGGYHIWVFLFRCDQEIAFKFGQILRAKFNLNEVFPKQASLNGTTGLGNWVRVPGIYPSKDIKGNEFFSQIDIGKEFIDIREDEAQEIIRRTKRITQTHILNFITKYKKNQEKKEKKIKMEQSVSSLAVKQSISSLTIRELAPSFVTNSNSELPVDSQEFVSLTLNELKETPNICDTYDDFLKLAMAFKSINLSYSEVDEIFKNGQGYNYNENKKIYEDLQPSKITFGTAYHLVKDKMQKKIKEIAKTKKIKETKKIEIKEIKETKETKEAKAKPKITVSFVEKLLEGRPEQLQYNEISRLITINGSPAKNTDILDLALEIVSLFPAQSQAKTQFVVNIIGKFARKNTFNPIEDWYNSLPEWKPGDTDYIKELANCIYGDDYIYRKLQIIFGQMLGKWQKGEQARVPVLSGSQGAGKSYFVRWLCPLKDYFIETSLNPTSKDDMIMASKFIMAELGELGAITKKADQEALKSFLTRKEFTVRPPYGRYEELFQHRCCWYGTVNQEGGFLFDQTGHRRFLVITITRIDWSYTQIPLEGIWSQAKYLYENGLHYITEQDKGVIDFFNEAEVVRDPIYDYLNNLYKITGDQSDFVPTVEILKQLNDYGIKATSGTSRKIKAYFLGFDNIEYTRRRNKGIQERGFTGITANY